MISAGFIFVTAPKEVGRWTIEIIKRRDAGKGFEVVPRRRGADRSFARRSLWETLTKDCEATIASAVAWAFPATRYSV